MADLNTLVAWLTTAETALNSLVTGGTPQEVYLDGQRVVYTPAKIPDLRMYITDLRARISAAGGTREQGAARRVVGTLIVGDNRTRPRRFV